MNGPFCIACRHCEIPDPASGQVDEQAKCLSPLNVTTEVSPVTGRVFTHVVDFVFCKGCRSSAGKCGPHAAHFEPISEQVAA